MGKYSLLMAVATPNGQFLNLRRWQRPLVVVVMALLSLMVWLTYASSVSLKRAQEKVNRGQLKEAAMFIEHVLEKSPDHIEALQLKARILGESSAFEAVPVLARVAAIQGTVSSYRRALEAAMTDGHPREAQRLALELIRLKPPDVGSWLLLLNEAIARRDAQGARARFEELRQKVFDVDAFQQAVWGLELRGESKELAERALSDLQSRFGEARITMDAARALIGFYFSKNQLVEAFQVSTFVIGRARASQLDRFNHLTLMKALGKNYSEYADKLAPSSELSSMALARGEIELAKRLGMGLDVSTSIAVFDLQMSMMAEIADWEGMKATLNRVPHYESNPMFFFWKGLCLSHLGNLTDSELAKRNAILAASEAGIGLERMRALASRYGWEKGAVDLAERMLKTEATRSEATDFLLAHYAKTKNLAGYASVVGNEIDRRPGDVVVINNFAATHLLLGLSREKALAAAEEAYKRRPDLEPVVSTFAYARLVANDAAAGVLALKTFHESYGFEHSLTWLYLALCLESEGEEEEARSMIAGLELAGAWPEERELLDSLRARL